MNILLATLLTLSYESFSSLSLFLYILGLRCFFSINVRSPDFIFAFASLVLATAGSFVSPLRTQIWSLFLPFVFIVSSPYLFDTKLFKVFFRKILPLLLIFYILIIFLVFVLSFNPNIISELKHYGSFPFTFFNTFTILSDRNIIAYFLTSVFFLTLSSSFTLPAGCRTLVSSTSFVFSLFCQSRTVFLCYGIFALMLALKYIQSPKFTFRIKLFTLGFCGLAMSCLFALFFSGLASRFNVNSSNFSHVLSDDFRTAQFNFAYDYVISNPDSLIFGIGLNQTRLLLDQIFADNSGMTLHLGFLLQSLELGLIPSLLINILFLRFFVCLVFSARFSSSLNFLLGFVLTSFVFNLTLPVFTQPLYILSMAICYSSNFKKSVFQK